MKTKRGRKSAAELAVAPVIDVEPRPVAHDKLTDEEAREWQAVVRPSAPVASSHK